MNQRASTTGGATRDRLKQIIAEKSVLSGGNFRLASGGESSLFFDMKMTLLDPEGAGLAADMILDHLEGKPVDAIGGIVLGACPIVSAVCVKSHERQPITGFYVRKEPKERGTEKLIEGPLAKGARVVLVEDVTTKGGSVMKAVEAVVAAGCEIVEIITIVDRQSGAPALLAENGLNLVALFEMDEFA